MSLSLAESQKKKWIKFSSDLADKADSRIARNKYLSPFQSARAMILKTLFARNRYSENFLRSFNQCKGLKAMKS